MNLMVAHPQETPPELVEILIEFFRRLDHSKEVSRQGAKNCFNKLRTLLG
jgi:hypothetical protein